MKIWPNNPACCLSIAGLDPTGGAGIIADILTFHRLGAWGTAAAAMIAPQGNSRVFRVRAVDSKLLQSQIEPILADFPIRSIKIGALGSRANIRLVSRIIEREKFGSVVVDPVLRARDGSPLVEKGAVRDYLTHLLPWAALVTPNLMELSELSGRRVGSAPEMEGAARALSRMGIAGILVKGGHLPGRPRDLLVEGEEYTWLPQMKRVKGQAHGIGCMLSSAICALLAQGHGLAGSVLAAREYVHRNLTRSLKLPGWEYRNFSAVNP